jgi:hypothetical protein
MHQTIVEWNGANIFCCSSERNLFCILITSFEIDDILKTIRHLNYSLSIFLAFFV